MKFFSWLVFILLSQITYGQVPGFMGKRFTIFLEANPTPAFFTQNINNEIISDPIGEQANTDRINRFAFNFRPQVTLEYLIGRDFSLGISYSLIRTGTAKPYSNHVVGNPSADDEPLDPDVMKGSAAGIHFKRYKFNQSASLAPIGFYQTLSIYGTMTNTYDTKKSHIKQFKNDFIYPVITFGVGRQSVLAKNILLKTGMEVGTAIVPSNFILQHNTDWTYQEYAGYNVHRNLFGYYVFSINLAVGYIPF